MKAYIIFAVVFIGLSYYILSLSKEISALNKDLEAKEAETQMLIDRHKKELKALQELENNNTIIVEKVQEVVKYVNKQSDDVSCVKLFNNAADRLWSQD